MVGHILLYHPAVVKLRQLIAQGALGRILYCYSNRLNMGLIRTEENILWSFAPHDISVMLHLLGEEPISAEAEGQSYLTPGVVDVTLSRLRFRSGATGHIFVSWLHPSKEQKLVVVGSEQMAVFDDTAEQKLLLYPHRVDWASRTPKAVKAEAVAVELEKAEPLKRRVPPLPRLRGQPADAAYRRPRGAPRVEGARRLPAVARRRPHRPLPASRAAVRTPGSRCPKRDFFAHESAYVDQPCTIGKGTKIWHFSHVMKGAKIGENCSIGQNVVDRLGRRDRQRRENPEQRLDLRRRDHRGRRFLRPVDGLHQRHQSRAARSSARTIPAHADPARRHAGGQLDDRLRPHRRPLRLHRGRRRGRLDVPDFALMAGVPARRIGWMCRCAAAKLQFDAAGRGRLLGLRAHAEDDRLEEWPKWH